MKQLFLPEYYNEKRLFRIKRAGIFFGRTSIFLVVGSEGRRGITIESCEEFILEEGGQKTDSQRRIAVLKSIAPRIAGDYSIHISIPAEQTISKEVTLPCLSEEKIRKVIDYEVESLIPFPLDEAILDFIELSHSEVKEQSKILVTATKKEVVEKYLQICEKAGINPTVITTDIIALASLYSALPALISERTLSLLILYEEKTLKCALLLGTKLVFARSSYITESTFDEEAFLTSLTTTLSAFERTQLHPPVLEKAFVITGDENYSFTAIKKAIEKELNITVTEFTGALCLEELKAKNLTTAETFNSHEALQALALITQSKHYRQFNLRRNELAIPIVTEISKYIITALALFSLLIVIIGGYGAYTIYELQSQADRIERVEEQKIRKILPPQQKKNAKNIKSLVKNAQTYLKEQEALWAPFSQQRLSPLIALQELSLLVNKKLFNITTERISIGAKEASDAAAESDFQSIEMEGLFKSQSGLDHFENFTQFEELVKNSRVLALTKESDPTQAEDGVHFTLNLKLRNVQQYKE